ncbi:bacteriohopanetetrol glucosamine biosynthesis glycosyltransferase HpnI [Sphingomonas sp. H39-1-10]|nr:bacteriohopanetetrol glucosamine biosynthesis glycosyltransferase HpnI [Sphingomonas pollutisoli]MDF0487283.1 bacteriohopanetetrol glucosamine biosynthesis glycosyltransferase HpnI [Sphingomonas pollutisoli]
MGYITAIFGALALALAAIGIGWMLAATIVLRRFFARPAPTIDTTTGVTILKPLHGAEPRILDNLASFLAQSHTGPVQLLCGVQRADDPAIRAIDALRRRHPNATIDLVIDSTRHGSSGKISNLANMEGAIAHPVVMLSDSDIAVGRDYVRQVLAALDAPGVGIVTCAYHGRGDAGFWSRLGAGGIDWQFLLGLIFGVANRLAAPCMGSTIAMRRETLTRIGGFARFADVLADDYAIGAAVRGLGLSVVVPPLLVTHAFDERSARALWRHELRWGVTVRDLALAPYAGLIVTFPLPMALLAALWWPVAGMTLASCALAVRLFAVFSVNRVTRGRAAASWVLPIRDIFGFAVYCASFFVRSVDWRGATLRIGPNGHIAAAPETLP